MKQSSSRGSVRTLALGAVVSLGLVALPALVEAAVHVDCGKNQKLATRVKTAGTKIIVKGTCTENLVITKDDISISTDGITPATITPADPTKPTIQLDGARRIVIDGVAAGGITVNGGTFGISATRNSSLDVRNCLVTGTSLNGVLSSYGSTVTVDDCTITGNAGNGAVAANDSSLVITSSLVTSNTLSGLVAVRGSYLRVGQDSLGTATVWPVTVSGNAANGIAITESSSGTVVGGTIETSGRTNLFVGGGSSGQIGIGLNSPPAPGVTIQNGSSHGVAIEGGNATIVNSTISGNALTGIIVANAGSARIGILNGNADYAGNTISNNHSNGIHVSDGAGAFIGGNTISGNGTAANDFGRFGIGVFRATAALAGGNTIQNNNETGIFVTAGQVIVGDSAFGLATTNTISGNGIGTALGTITGGVFAFNGGVIRVFDTTISNNTGAAVQAFEAGVIELGGTTAVTVPSTGTAEGANIQLGSTLRLRDTASIVSATSDGIKASNLSAINIFNGNTVTGSGSTAVGVRCLSITGAPSGPSAATLTGGDLTHVTGTTGPSSGCSTFP